VGEIVGDVVATPGDEFRFKAVFTFGGETYQHGVATEADDFSLIKELFTGLACIVKSKGFLIMPRGPKARSRVGRSVRPHLPRSWMSVFWAACERQSPLRKRCGLRRATIEALLLFPNISKIFR
jgi:hypothetical protein